MHGKANFYLPQLLKQLCCMASMLLSTEQGFCFLAAFCCFLWLWMCAQKGLTLPSVQVDVAALDAAFALHVPVADVSKPAANGKQAARAAVPG